VVYIFDVLYLVEAEIKARQAHQTFEAFDVRYEIVIEIKFL